MSTRATDLTRSGRTQVLELIPYSFLVQGTIDGALNTFSLAARNGVTRGLAFTNEFVGLRRKPIRVTGAYAVVVAQLDAAVSTLKIGISSDDDAIVASTNIGSGSGTTAVNTLIPLTLVSTDGIIIPGETVITITTTAQGGAYRLFLEYEFLENE